MQKRKRNKKFSSIGRDLTQEIKVGKTYKTNLRPIKSIAIHCSDSPQGRGDDAFTIDRWHLERWGVNSGIGYHYVILEDGTIQKGRWIDKVGAHVKRHNRHTAGIVYIGQGNITLPQMLALKLLVKLLLSLYDLESEDVLGHNEYSGYGGRGCPLINMEEVRDL